MNKKMLTLLMMLFMSGSLMAKTYQVTFETDARGGKGVFTTQFTNPNNGKTESKSTNGHDKSVYFDVYLQEGQKLKLE